MFLEANNSLFDFMCSHWINFIMRWKANYHKYHRYQKHMITLLFIKLYKNCKPFLSKPISNVKYPEASWEADSRASQSSTKALHVAQTALLASSPTTLTSCSLRSCPGVTHSSPTWPHPYPSSILLPPPGILYFPLSTMSHLTQFLTLGSSQWAPLHACSPFPDPMLSLPDLDIPFSADCTTLEVVESQ